MLRAGRNVLLCNSPVNKHLASVRSGRCPLPATESGTSTMFNLVVTRSDNVVAQGNNHPWRKRLKNCLPGLDQTEVVVEATSSKTAVSALVLSYEATRLSHGATNSWWLQVSSSLLSHGATYM